MTFILSIDLKRSRDFSDLTDFRYWKGLKSFDKFNDLKHITEAIHLNKS